MKKTPIIVFAALVSFSLFSCNDKPPTMQEVETVETAQGGQSVVKDDLSQRNIVQAAAATPELSTLVKAVKQAELVDALSNAGPFTVFAPVNAAFDALPKGTVEDLMKSENREKLRDILQYHVSVAVLREDLLQDGQTIGQVNGSNIKISRNGETIMVNDAKILGAVPVSNGIVYTIDKVLLPQ